MKGVYEFLIFSSASNFEVPNEDGCLAVNNSLLYNQIKNSESTGVEMKNELKS